jgi:hypothetical protein
MNQKYVINRAVRNTTMQLKMLNMMEALQKSSNKQSLVNSLHKLMKLLK